MRAVVAVQSRGEPLDETVVEAALLGGVPYPDAAVRTERWSAPDRQMVIVSASNEPDDSAGLIRKADGDRVWTHVGQLRTTPRIEVTERLAQRIAETPGRFSLLAVDPVAGRMVAVTSPSGADPLFVGERDGVLVVSSWAGVASALTNRAPPEVDPIAVCSMINNGFMATRRTPYPGIRSLSPACALIAHRGGSTVHDHLATMMAGQRHGSTDRVDRVHAAFVAAIAPLRDAGEPVRLSLSGGKDSRLILAGLLAAGVEVHASTISMGSANAEDVDLATRIAKLTGVKHEVRPAMASQERPADRRVDLISDTCHTLRLTDGMLHGFRTFGPRHEFRAKPVILGGGGGEVLRGGYGHGFFSPRFMPPTALVGRELSKRFTRFSTVLRRDVVDEYGANLQDELAGTTTGFSGPQMLDRAYLDYRSCCWLSMSLRADSLSVAVVHPACDNALVTAALAIDPAERSSERTTYELMRRLSPKLAALPFAEDEWGFRRSFHRKLLRLWHKRIKATKSAPAVSATNTDWRARFHLPPLSDEFARMIADGCSNSVLDRVVDGDALQKVIRSEQWAPPRYTQLAFNLYSAAALCSGAWRSTPDPRPTPVPEL